MRRARTRPTAPPPSTPKPRPTPPSPTLPRRRALAYLRGLLSQVERLAGAVGVPFEAYLDLVSATVDNVRELGPAAALTGPAARGAEATIRRHLEALPEDERDAYRALADAARRLAATR